MVKRVAHVSGILVSSHKVRKKQGLTMMKPKHFSTTVFDPGPDILLRTNLMERTASWKQGHQGDRMAMAVAREASLVPVFFYF